MFSAVFGAHHVIPIRESDSLQHSRSVLNIIYTQPNALRSYVVALYKCLICMYVCIYPFNLERQSFSDRTIQFVTNLHSTVDSLRTLHTCRQEWNERLPLLQHGLRLYPTAWLVQIFNMHNIFTCLPCFIAMGLEYPNEWIHVDLH